jgi:hypothetical protein
METWTNNVYLFLYLFRSFNRFLVNFHANCFITFLSFFTFTLGAIVIHLIKILSKHKNTKSSRDLFPLATYTERQAT